MLDLDNPSDTSAMFVVVRGIENDAFELAAIRFNTRRGGADPSTFSHYISIPIQPDQLADCLSWIQSTIADRFEQVLVTASVGTDLTWSNVLLSPSFLSIVSHYNATLSVNFSSSAAFLKVTDT